ncbi:MAG: hypothetical protein A2Z27_01605 [candidate division Zixibacteria bacterium RBG_16_50_21]|nr:MAG: hypothetical protein A2Z27_01605 [candidate division Zixibacteria bacterium RBG_16_50_21]
MKLKYALSVLLCLLLTSAGLAQNNNAGTSSADFLKIGVGAKAAGFGEAFVAIADDATGAFWNAAGLAHLNQSQVTFMHNEWLSDVRYEYLSYAAPYQDKGTFAISMSYLSLGKFEGYDLSGNPTNDFSAYDWSGVLAYGHRVTPQLSLGASVKYFQETIEGVKAGAFAGDLGALYSLSQVNLGLSVRNFGTKMKFIEEEYSLPLTVDMGVAFRGFSNLLLAVDLEIPKDNAMRLKQGLEYTYHESVFFRMGYGLKTSGNDYQGASGLAVGAGFLLKDYRFDYAYSPNADLGDAHRVSFTINFGPVRGI